MEVRPAPHQHPLNLSLGSDLIPPIVDAVFEYHIEHVNSYQWQWLLSYHFVQPRLRSFGGNLEFDPCPSARPKL